MEYNVYCDESCHLENDDSSYMVLGAVYCSKDKIKEINNRICEIKEHHNINRNSEIKWTKVSLNKEAVYRDIINYFFDNDDLHFRCLIADKTKLNHDKYHQTHDLWYYKMYFNMLKILLKPSKCFNIYIDIKDTHSYEKCQKLLDVCRNSKYDFSGKIIKKIQPIRSNEVQIMQITDILTGAIGYKNRVLANDIDNINMGKVHLIDLIHKRSGYALTKSTLPQEDKLNIFKWEPDYDSH